MVQLALPKIECTEQAENFGRFVAERLEKGFGVTLGNSLRRVLLGYLPGAAVTQVRIEGVQHEFTVIPNAKEDVMEFLLNVKAIRFKPASGKPAKLILEAQGEGPVTAGNIQPSNDVEITNPDMVLLNLTDPEARLVVEFDVDLGIGYKVAESTDSMPVGTIPIDAVFSPIRKVNFTVEASHVGQETKRERLLLHIWTDGTVSPTDALSQGAGILIEQLAPFQDYANVSQMKADERLIRLSIPNEKYDMPVEKLDLSVRTMNCLRRSGITTVGELIAKGPKELLKLRNFGQKSFQEIEEKLASVGLSLTPPAEEGAPPEGAAAETEEAAAGTEEAAAETEEAPTGSEEDSQIEIPGEMHEAPS